MRRCASTVKPPIDTNAISNMPTVANASTMVDGLMMLGLLDPGVVMYEDREPRDLDASGDASKRTLTSVGCVT
jgi:hypothetical protein